MIAFKGIGKYRGTTTKDRRSHKIHRLLVEKILGKLLPNKAEIHHIDGNKSNNDLSNLIVCPNRKYHFLLHSRQRLINAKVSPWTHVWCTKCGPKLMADFHKNSRNPNGFSALCMNCDNLRKRIAYDNRIA